ncbi:MAG TPA: sugar ABC transporter permease [Thermoflexus sp.]|nr:sugar ABC transporter permease [Thermoflexus sp.]
MVRAYLYTLIWAAGTVVFILLCSLAMGGAARLLAKWRGLSRNRQEEVFAGYAFAAPWIVGFVIFVVAPTLASLYWSFTSYRLPAPPVFVGLANYLKLLLRDMDFRAALLNTLYLTVFGLPAQMVVALALALLLNQRIRGRGLYRAAFYMPVFLGTNAAVLLSWVFMLNANTGFLNQILRLSIKVFPPLRILMQIFIFVIEVSNAAFLGVQTGNFTLLQRVWQTGLPGPERVPLWLEHPLWIKAAIILLMVWSCGNMMLIYLAALSNIPRELQEAAEVDGAGPWQRFWHITLPLLSPATFYNLIVGLIATMQMFEQPYVLLRDRPTLAQAGHTVVYYLWRATFRFNEIGYGAAISWVLTVLIMIITLIQFRLERRWVHYEL